MKQGTSFNTTFLLRAFALDRQEDFPRSNSGDTFNQLSLTTCSLWSLKLLERQECQTLCEIPRRSKIDKERSDRLDLFKFDFFIDQKNIKLSEEHSSFICPFYIKTTDIIYPHENYFGLPITTLRFMLKELRLLFSKNNTVPERHVYFYPDTNNYIAFELIDNEVFSVKLFRRKLKKQNNIFHTFLSREGKIESRIYYCKFNEFFSLIYNTAESLCLDIKDGEELGGDLSVLEEQLRLSKSLIKKLSNN